MTLEESPPIIGYLMYCVPCKKERFELISHEGITDKAFRVLQRNQMCTECNSGDSLDFRPIRKGENLEQVVNEIMGEHRKQLQEQTRRKTIPLVEVATEDIMKEYTFITIEETGEIWYYDKGVYVRGGEIVIAKEAEAIFGYDLTKSKLGEIMAHVMRRTYHSHEELDTDINIINVKNGLYDVDNDMLSPYSRIPIH